MATPKKREKSKPSLESVPTSQIVKALRAELGERLKEIEAKHPPKKPKK